MKAIKRILAGLVVLAAVAGAGFYLRPVAYFNGLMYVQAFFAGVESHTITIAGYRVHYNAEGPKTGAPVVLVHGLGGRAEDWRGLAQSLAAAGYRVYMPDLPGYGRSEQPADFSYAVHDEAEQVVHFLDAMGLKKVDLGGWSMGGGIVQHVAFRHADRVHKLMLFDAVGIYELPKWNVKLFTPRSAAELGQLEALLTPKPPQVPGFIARDVVRLSNKDGWVIDRAVEQMLNGKDATDALLPQFKMPVLVVWGGADKIFPVSQAETMHRLIPQSELVVIPGCGHLAPGECTDRIAPKVAAFLQQ
jgi:pimeloyl-ACP methyl ester carboxylesterase